MTLHNFISNVNSVIKNLCSIQINFNKQKRNEDANNEVVICTILRRWNGH